MQETKNEKFIRLSTARVEKAVKAISLLENLSGANYEYSVAQVQEVVDQLTEAVQSVSQAYGLSPIVLEQPKLDPEVEKEIEDNIQKSSERQKTVVEPTNYKWTDWQIVDQALTNLMNEKYEEAKKDLVLALGT